MDRMKLAKKFALATFVLTLMVIVAGGVVRTTQSGMGCPDWPKCFGMWVPPTTASQLPADFEKYLKAQDIDHTFNAYHTWIEYINRLLGALLGVFAIIQLAIIYFKQPQNSKALKLAVAFLAIVILTGLFGAIVVKLNLAHISISVHLVFAIALTQVQLALTMALGEKLFKKTVGLKMRRMLALLLAVILIQFVLGTLVRMYVDDVSKALHYQQREAWLSEMPLLFLLHRSFSWVVLLGTFYAAWYAKKVPALKISMQRISLLVFASFIVGVILFYADIPVVAQPLHLLLATLTITQTMYAILYTKNFAD